ncbi:MAG: response regulator [Alphaproteobacteria bacterium]|nr:MAG: response regulator [Alphaproteobacteria bacterium]
MPVGKITGAGAFPPEPALPLQGMTILLVEDSRLASEALRLLCLRSGARLRRADSLAAAHRHLAVYRPNIVIVDAGLPDGDGATLIAEMSRVGAENGGPVVIGCSGDPGAEEAARAAGAQAFLPKPVESLAAFQETLLSALAEGAGETGLHVVAEGEVVPDDQALADDLRHAEEIIRAGNAPRPYIAQFLGGVARVAHDTVLADAAERLSHTRAGSGELHNIAQLLRTRLASLPSEGLSGG